MVMSIDITDFAEQMAKIGARPDEATINPNVMNVDELRAFVAMKTAARVLRYSELALHIAKEGYLKALDDLNNAIAPERQE
jgi:hypothetical protein